MTKIVVNGREVDADPKKPLIAACHGNGFDVPTYCYHPGLTPVGSCRICQVEVKQGEVPSRVVVACRTPVAEGMIVNTESERSHQTRRECLEFLLKNHPLDCPICDKAGECDLQDFAYAEGQSSGRTNEPRRKLEKRKALGDVIVLDEERCILCSRCVRFFEEIPKKAQLTVSDLGSRSVISTFQDRPLTGNYQGNIADLCPVGALTLKEFRFQARVWNLLKTASTCGECSRGCSTQVEVLRSGEVKRFRPRENPAVNQWWMCDVGRFAFGPVNRRDRAPGAVVRGAQGLEFAPVEEALAILQDILAIHPAAELIASPFLTVEEGEAVLAFARERKLAPRFLSPLDNGLKDDLLHTGDPCPNRRGLVELGFEAIEPAAAIERLRASESALLVGDRIGELVGLEALASLPTSLRLFVFDCVALDVPALDALLGLPTHVERTGTWVNVDGVRGPISAAKPPPPDVRTITRLLQTLAASRSTLGSAR
ncbi:MAG: 2Fe-2S iron-sulfur cluster-binding protein [Planctomycetota bacterium]